jgi:hypothetical protein
MDPIFWAAIGATAGVVTASLSFAAFWMRISGQIEIAKTDASSAGLRATQANLKIDMIQDKFSDFQRYAEKEFANHGDLSQLSLRHEAQFDDLREDLKGITSRLDRLLDNRKPGHN